MTNRKIHSTTILCVSRGDKTTIISDSQVTAGSMIEKDDINKLRTLGADKSEGDIIAGFAGIVADCFALTDMLRKYLKENMYNLEKSVHNLVREWRKKENKHLVSTIIIADKRGNMYEVNGDGLIIKPSESRGMILATGSGSIFAYSAALSLMRECPKLTSKQICEKSMAIASELDIYTNDKFNILEVSVERKSNN